MPKYQYLNIHTGEIEEWTARNDLGVMEREDGIRWTIHGFDDEYGQCPSFLSCHKFIMPAGDAANAGDDSSK